ncbi:hypothetical protein D9M71_422710 [compost metagenome]
MFIAPALKARTVNALGLVVVEIVAQALVFEPGAGFLHGVAGLDSIKVQWRVAFGHVLPPWEKMVKDYAMVGGFGLALPRLFVALCYRFWTVLRLLCSGAPAA